MGYREELESYLSLSRKELQVLCKNNNLPANRSHAQLAKSLASFSKKTYPVPSSLEEKSIGRAMPKESKYLSEVNSKDFIGLHERTNFVESGSSRVLPCMKEKECGEKQHFLTGNVMTISSHTDHQAFGNVYNTATNASSTVNLAPKQFDCSTSKAGNGCPVSSVAASTQQTEKDMGLGSEWHMGRTFNELKKCSELRNSYQIALNHAASKSDTHDSVPKIVPRDAKSSRKGGFLSSEEMSTEEIPSFQFFVMSEEGIDLHVDLYSSPSEWINSLKDEVYINLNMQESKSSSLPKHSSISSAEADAHVKISEYENIGTNFHINRVDRNSDCTTSTLSSDSENCRSVAAQPDATFASSDSSVLTSSSIPVKMPGYLDENQVIPSCVTPLSVEKRMAFDASSSPGDGNAFSEDMVESSSRIEKINTSGISMTPINDTKMSSPEGATNTEQMECPTLKIDDVWHAVETNGLCTSLASIPEENNLLNSGETEETLSFEVGNLEKDTDACKVSIEREPVVGPSEVAADHNCGQGGHLVLDCATTGSRSDVNFNCHAFNLDTYFAKDPISVLNQELGKSTEAEGKEISECLRSEKSSENNSKRTLSPESNEEFSSKRHHSNENKNGMIVNLRSTRTSAKETKSEHVPRRSTRLLEGVCTNASLLSVHLCEKAFQAWCFFKEILTTSVKVVPNFFSSFCTIRRCPGPHPPCLYLMHYLQPYDPYTFLQF